MSESFLPQGSARLQRPRLKICGLTDPGQAAAIASLGVDAIGVVAVPGSPRFLGLEQRSTLFAAVRNSSATCVGVLVVADPPEEDRAMLTAGHGHRVVQLHGTETVEWCRQLRASLGPEMGLWKALRIRCQDDLHRAQAYAGVVDALLLDAWVPGQLGGTGRSIPLEWLAGFAPPLPWWLAGGISPETVGEILQTVHPEGLDVSSGVEIRPGWKDLERVRWLVDQLGANGSTFESTPSGPKLS